MFRLTIQTDNEAFQPDARPELARILVALADRIESGEDFSLYRNVCDINGNVVGKVKLEHESEAE